jgi:hypothetical protein
MKIREKVKERTKELKTVKELKVKSDRPVKTKGLRLRIKLKMLFKRKRIE